MDWQLWLTWTAIALAATFVIWRGVSARRAMKGGCGGGCAKSNAATEDKPPLIARDQLVLRERNSRSS
jgi:hypothetical protein